MAHDERGFELSRLIEKNRDLRREIRIMQEAAERRNRELDALRYVWCDGGCGIHRYAHGELTEELVTLAERNTLRLRRWLINARWKRKEISRLEWAWARVRWKLQGWRWAIRRQRERLWARLGKR